MAVGCPPGSYRVRSHPRTSYYKADETLGNATQVKESCREKDPVYNHWFPRLKDGAPPNWPQKKEKLGKWTIAQQERVLEAIRELPEELWATPLEGVYRLSKS